MPVSYTHLNRLLHNNNSSKVVFNDICEILNEILASNVLVVSKKGKVLGSGQLLYSDIFIMYIMNMAAICLMDGNHRTTHVSFILAVYNITILKY